MSMCHLGIDTTHRKVFSLCFRRGRKYMQDKGNDGR